MRVRKAQGAPGSLIRDKAEVRVGETLQFRFNHLLNEINKYDYFCVKCDYLWVPVRSVGSLMAGRRRICSGDKRDNLALELLPL